YVSLPTVNLPFPARLASPFSQSILFFLNRYSTPAVLACTTLSLWPPMVFRSSETPDTFTPSAPICLLTSSYRSDANSSALDGIQPTLRHVPPRLARFSTQAVFRPSCAQRIAQT